MKAVRSGLAAAAAGAALLAAPAIAGGHRSGDSIAEALWTLDRGPYDRLGTRIHRTAIEDGYFGHGRSDGRGGYEYDRGYPYDHYNYERWERAEEAEAAPPPREMRCRTQSVRDEESREEVPVTICRG